MTIISLSSLPALSPEVFLLTTLCILLLYAVISSKSILLRTNYSKENGFATLRTPILISNISYLFVFSLVFVLIFLMNQIEMLSIDNGYYQNFYIIDRIAAIGKFVLALATLIVILISQEYLLEYINVYEYILLLAFTLLGLFLLVSSNDLISFYLALELQSLASYVLSALLRTSVFSTEAAVKYFILGALSSGILLLGGSLIYGFCGTTNFNDIHLISSNYGIPHIGFLFVYISLLFKLAAVPFHMWAPDVYEGSATSVTAYFAIVPKFAILILLVRFSYTVVSHVEISASILEQVLAFCAIGSMVLGSISAIYQRRIKRLFAYSAIAHMGYTLIGFTGIASGVIGSSASIYFYMMLYMITMLGTFAIILGCWNRNLRYITDLKGLYLYNPTLAFVFTVLLLSLTGVPPLAGFFSKLFIFFTAVQASVYGILMIAIITSVIGAFYTIRLVKFIYFNPINTDFIFNITRFTKLPVAKLSGTYNAIFLSISFLIVATFCLYPYPLLTAITWATV